MGSERRADGGRDGRAEGARESGETREKRRVFRSTTAVVFGVVWLAFAAANFVDLALRGRGPDAVTIAAVLLLGTAVVYVTCLRPRIVADEDGVTAHNAIRDVWVPWHALDRVDATDAVRLHVGDRRFRCWALQTPRRARARARLREQVRAARYGAPTPDPGGATGYTRTDQVAFELDGMARRLRDRPSPEPTSVTWSPPALAALGGGALLLVVTVVVGNIAWW